MISAQEQKKKTQNSSSTVRESKHLEEGDGLVESCRHDNLGRGVELDAGQLVTARTSSVGVETLLDLLSTIRDTQTHSEVKIRDTQAHSVVNQ